MANDNQQGYKDFLAALQEFKTGMQDFNRTRIVQQANEKVQEIRSSQETEQKKRASLQEVSNQLVGYLAGDNTPASTIQEIVKAFGPQQVNTPEQAILQGTLQGNQGLVQAGTEAAIGQRKVNKDLDNEFRRKLQQDLLDAQLRMAGKKVEAKAAEKKILPVAEAEKVMALDEEAISGNDILNRFKKSPRFVGAQNRVWGAQTARELSDPEFAAFKSQVGQWFDQYRVRVTGAGASPGELKLLEKNRPAVTDEPKVFEAKINRILEIGKKLKQNKVKSLDALGYNVNGLNDISTPMEQTAASAAIPGLPPGAVPVTINGVVGAGIKMPDGRILRRKVQ